MAALRHQANVLLITEALGCCSEKVPSPGDSREQQPCPSTCWLPRASHKSGVKTWHQGPGRGLRVFLHIWLCKWKNREGGPCVISIGNLSPLQKKDEMLQRKILPLPSPLKYRCADGEGAGRGLVFQGGEVQVPQREPQGCSQRERWPQLKASGQGPDTPEP